jgi:hypothetical protein
MTDQRTLKEIFISIMNTLLITDYNADENLKKQLAKYHTDKT